MNNLNSWNNTPRPRQNDFSNQFKPSSQKPNRQLNHNHKLITLVFFVIIVIVFVGICYLIFTKLTGYSFIPN